MAIVNELVIDAPVEQVWALTVDVESWPAMTSTITGVERLDAGPLGVGSTARIKQPGQPARVWTVTAIEPNTLFAWQTKAFGVTMVATHRLRPVAHGCHNTLSIDLSGALSGVVSALLGKQFRAAITTENEGFRRAAEGARH